MASKLTLIDVLRKELEGDMSARYAAAEMLLLIATRSDWASNAGTPARLLDLMGYIAKHVHNSETLHRALRPEFARIVEASDI